MKVSLNHQAFVQWIAAALIFLQIEPYFVWPLHKYIVYYNTVPLMLILASHAKFDSISIHEFFFVAISILAALCARYNILGVGMSALLVLLFLCDKRFLIGTFIKFRKIYVVLITFSMVVWLLLLLGVSVPYRVVPPLNSLKQITYSVYPFLIRINDLSVVSDTLYNSLRFMGLFDEPGVVGTVSLMMLFVGRFDLKKKYNVILLLSGIISFSLFFYVAAVVFLTYNVLFVSNSKRIYKALIIVLLGGLLSYSYLNPVTNELIWNRLEWDSSRNTISGNNRSGDELDAYVENIKGTDAYYWGVGNAEIGARFSGSASIKNALLRYGIVVLVLFFVFYYFYSRRYIKSLFMRLVFIAFLYMTLYQRPSFFVIHYLFLFNMSVYAYSSKYQMLFEDGEETVKKTSVVLNDIK